MGFQKHDFSKRMNPAYSFGQRLPNSKYYKQQKRLSLAMHWNVLRSQFIALRVFPQFMDYLFSNKVLYYLLSAFKDECSPGPQYKIDPRITKTGLDGTPAYSILGQQKDQGRFNNDKHLKVTQSIKKIEALK